MEEEVEGGGLKYGGGSMWIDDTNTSPASSSSLHHRSHHCPKLIRIDQSDTAKANESVHIQDTVSGTETCFLVRHNRYARYCNKSMVHAYSAMWPLPFTIYIPG